MDGWIWASSNCLENMQHWANSQPKKCQLVCEKVVWGFYGGNLTGKISVPAQPPSRRQSRVLWVTLSQKHAVKEKERAAHLSHCETAAAAVNSINTEPPCKMTQVRMLIGTFYSGSQITCQKTSKIFLNSTMFCSMTPAQLTESHKKP